MADVSDQIANEHPDIEPERYLEELGSRVADIDPGIEGIVDLARGGANKIWGAGFLPEYDDGTIGQARHFAGVSAAVERFGPDATTHAAIVFLDPAGSADGRLSDRAVEFATLLLDGDLAVGEAGDWIRTEICSDQAWAEGG